MKREELLLNAKKLSSRYLELRGKILDRLQEMSLVCDTYKESDRNNYVINLGYHHLVFSEDTAFASVPSGGGIVAVIDPDKFLEIDPKQCCDHEYLYQSVNSCLIPSRF